MASRIATLRLQLIDSVTGPSKKTSEALKGLETAIGRLGKNGVAGAKNLGNQLDYLRRKAAAVGEFSQLRRGLAQTYGSFREARAHAKRLEDALAAVTKPTAKMNAEMRTARSALKSATTAFNEQRSAVRSAEQALRSYSITSRSRISSSQRRVREEMSQTIRKMREMERENRKPQPRPGGGGGGGSRSPSVAGVAAGAAGGYAMHRAGGIARNAFMDTVSYDQAKSYRDALGYDVFDAAGKAAMNAQAEKIGYETRFTNADVVKGQVGLLQGGIRDSGAIMNAMQPITDYALAMGVTLEEATETIRSASQIRQIPLTDVKKINSFVDSLVWMAKNAGMDDSDVRQYVRYGGAAMQSAGLKDQTANAMGVVLRRAGYKGDEAGVFARTASAKLASPTNPGRIALQSMGLNYDDYVTQPDAFKVRGIAKMIQENFGVRLTQDVQDQITKYIDEETFFNEELGEDLPVGSDRGMFTSGIMDLIEPMFGKMSAKDKKDVAKKLGDFHKFSAESVDTERLLMDILQTDPTIAQLNAFFTQRQGARASILSKRLPEFLQAMELMNNTPEGITNTIGVKANEGLYGDFTRATGAIETALIKMVEDWGTPISGILKSVDHLASEFTQLSQTTRRVIEVMGALALAAGGYAAMRATRGIIGRVLGFGGGGAGKAGGGKGPAVIPGGGKTPRTGVKGLASGALGAVGVIETARYLDEVKKEQLGQESALYAPSLFDIIKLYGMTAQAGVNKAERGGTPSWKKFLLGDAADPNFTLKGHMGVKTKAGADGSANDLGAMTASWPAAAQQGIQAYIQALSTGGAEAEAKASAIGEQIKTELSVTGTPLVDTASLERALSLARQVSGAVRGIGGASVSSSGGSLDPKLDGRRALGGPVKAGGIYEVNERGQELFSPGSDGTIIPHNKIGQLGGGGTTVSVSAPINIKVEVKNGDPASVEAAIKRGVSQAAAELEAKLSRSLQTVFGNVSYGDA
ncbi:phage tail tape measure protein [Brucella sp. TWI432]